MNPDTLEAAFYLALIALGHGPRGLAPWGWTIAQIVRLIREIDQKDSRGDR